ncbi:hypothetical protein EG329_013828 [Mollisiaceae sp. DMI_Dod_QoI]|nr:hypothetical protein EG329_013828 [Helotiales sp. DMI_Dod_QoI]
MADSVNVDTCSSIGVIITDSVYGKILPSIGGKLKDTDSSIRVNELCSKCRQLSQNSPILLSLSQDNAGQNTNVPETHEFGTLGELLLSYHGGCHLCALLWNSLFESFGRERLCNLDAKLNVRVELKTDPLEEERIQTIYKDFVKGMHIEAKGATFELVIDGVRGEFTSTLLNISTVKDLDYTSFQVEIPLSSRSDHVFGTIQSWYKNCLAHENCQNFQRTIKGDAFPSRLLDLHGGSVKLATQTRKLPEINYTTLSHRWGNPTNMLKLTLKSLSDFEDISMKSLPWTYKDAIRVTLALGCSYIWIDSLCIIQDSLEDWESEGGKMAGIYGGAICNISYVGCASDSVDPPTASFRDPRLFLPCVLKKAFNQEELSLIAQPSFERRDGHAGLSSFEGPLSDRAWIFQERILCPRTIYYGGPQLIWECSEGFQTEFSEASLQEDSLKKSFREAFDIKLFKETTEGNYVENYFQSISNKKWRLEMFRNQWSTLITRYRRKKLTVESDRVIALAGIVDAVQKMTVFNAVCGFWKETFAMDMCWTRNSDPRKLQGPKWNQEFPVPSWSWYAASMYQNGSAQENANVSHWYGRALEKGLWEENWSATEVYSALGCTLLYTARLLSCELADPPPLRPLTRFYNAKVKIQTYCSSVWLIRRNDMWTLAAESPKLDFKYWQDEDGDEGTDSPRIVNLLLLMDWIIDCDSSHFRCQIGLVIIPVEGELWRRVGFFRSIYNKEMRSEAQLPCLHVPALLDIAAMMECTITLI